MRFFRLHALAGCLLIASAHLVWAQTVQLAKDINEAIVSIPVVINGKATSTQMVGTVFKPDGDGPFPFVVLNHGRAGSAAERLQVRRWRYTDNARWLVRSGFAVFVATRRGYGDTGGADVETNYNCNNPWYKEPMSGGVESVLSVVEFAKQQPYTDKSRYIVMGQSVGGFLSVGTGAANPEGLVAVINFAGGHGGRPDRDPGNPCAEPKLRQVFADAGKTSRVPSLWVYTENDKYFAAEHTKGWHEAFVAAGGKAEYKLMPAFGNDGHALFVRGPKLWQPVVAEFLKSVGF